MGRRGGRGWVRLWLGALWGIFCPAVGVISAEGHTISYKGDVNIGVLVNLHNSAEDANNELVDSNCGSVNMEAVQQVLAAKWAVDVINNQSLPHELRIGLQIHDTCNNLEVSQDHLYRIISTVQQDTNKNTTPAIIGLIGMGSHKSLEAASAALDVFHVPLVTVSPGFHNKIGSKGQHNVLTTAPDMEGQARALANIAYEFGGDRVSLISSSQSTMSSFLAESTTLGVRVPNILEVVPRQVNLGPAVEGFLRSLVVPRPVVAMVLEARDAVVVAEHLKNLDLPVKPTWLVGSLGLDLRRLKSWRKVFTGGAFVEPHMPELREFKSYFLSTLKNPDKELTQLANEYMTENFGCVTGDNSGKGVACSNIPHREMDIRFQQDPKVSFVVKAVSALTAAFRLVQLNGCGADISPACLRSVSPDLHQDILANLHKLSFTSMSGLSEVEGTRHHFTKSGRLVANKQIVYTIDEATGLEPIGWYSEDAGLNLRNFATLPSTTQQPITAPRSSPLVNGNNIINSNNINDRTNYARSIDDDSAGGNQEPDFEERPVDEKENVRQETLPEHAMSYDAFMGRTWALVVVSVAIFGVCISMWMVVYVTVKICDGTLNGNQTMGVLLLFGVMSVFGSVLPWLLPPTETVCALRHFFHPLAFSLCFGILLVKVMQLRSLVSVGLGGTIPQVNQLLSLFFMVMVQVVISTEWYVINMPLGLVITDDYPECGVSRSTFLLLHVYPCILLLLTFFYGMSVIKIKRNFNEGRWVTCSAICIIPIFAAWSVVYYFAPYYFHDPSVAVSIVAVGVILLSAIFFPKMHTIAQQSRFKKHKLHSAASDSTLFTTYTDYAPYNMYYPVRGGYHPMNGPYFPRYPKMFKQGGPGMAAPPPAPYKANKFNGLNYLSDLSALPTAYTDWSREHTPGTLNSHRNSAHKSAKKISINSGRYHQDGKKSKSKTPDGTLANDRKLKPSLKQQQQAPHQGLLLDPDGLQLKTPFYDKKSRVYHIHP